MRFGPWWRVFFFMVVLQLVFVGLAAMFDVSFPMLVATVATKFGGHYYTWLNVTGPGLMTAFAVARCAHVGLCWAKSYDDSDTTDA